jgi:hypothetical protein
MRIFVYAILVALAIGVIGSISTAAVAQAPDGAHTHPALEARISALETRVTALEVKPSPTPTASPTPSATPSPTATATTTSTPTAQPTPSPTSTPRPPTPTPTVSPTPSSTPAPASSNFTVSGPNLYDPAGNRFVVRGLTPIYGPFAGGDSDGQWSTYSLTNNAAIFAGIKAQWNGVNTVRIFTSGGAVAGHAGADWNLTDYRNKLYPVVANARAQGFVVVLVNSYSNTADSNAWITELADRYRGDPYVWLTPSNEPLCTSPDAAEKAKCVGGSAEWAAWRTYTQAQVDLIRSRGFHNVILLNGPNWSWYWNGYTNYTITDPDSRLVFGVHRYANGNGWTSAEVASVNASWANLASFMPIVADEIGNYNGGGQNTLWYQGMTDFLATWTNTRGGAGAIGFNSYWSDANSMTTNGVTRNAWGTYYNGHFLGVAR